MIDILQELADALAAQRDAFATVFLPVTEVVPVIVADAWMDEQKTKEKKRTWGPTGMTTGKKELKLAKTAEQRRMKLQYKSDRRSNVSRRLPARFGRR